MAAPRPSPARGQDAGRKSPSASPWFPTPACRQRGLHLPWRATREGIEGLRVLLGEDRDDVREAIHLIGRVRREPGQLCMTLQGSETVRKERAIRRLRPPIGFKPLVY